MHENSRLIFDRFARPHFRPTLSVLEIGPDKPSSTFREMLDHSEHRWTTADIHPLAQADLTLTHEYDPVPAWRDTFDIVFSANVLEHVRHVREWMTGLAEMVKPGGKIITIAPISWPYHEAPVDCQRIFPEGMRVLSAYAGLTVLYSEFHSLEDIGWGTLVPGRAQTHITEPECQRVYHNNLTKGGPVEAAVDCITIAQRPSV